MKKIFTLTLLFFLCFTLDAQTISLTNGGFESGLNNWTTSGAGASFTVTSGAHTGTKRLKVNVESVSSLTNAEKITHDAFQTSSDRIYMVRFWAKAGQNNSMIYLNINGATTSQLCKIKVDSTFGSWVNGWQMFQFLFKAQESPLTVDLTFRSRGNFYIDDVEILDDTQPVLDLKTQLMWQNNLTGYGWLSGDNDVSVLLPDGRTAWIFSDSFVGNPYPDENYLRSGAMVNNIMVVQGGTNNDTLWSLYGGTSSSPSSLVKSPTSGALYWVTDGVVEGDTLKVMFNEWINGGGDFNNKAGVACFKLPELTLIKQTVPTYNGTDIPNALFNDGDYTYIYLAQRTSNPFERFGRVARVPKGTMDDPSVVWQYYLTDGTWGTNLAQAKAMVSGVEPGSVRKLGEGNYVMSGVPHLSREIAVWFSKTPWGPWGNKKVLYTRPDETGLLSYFGHLHECEGTPNGEYVLSCSLYPFGGYVPQQKNDKGTYLPIFIKANLKSLSPFTDLKTEQSGDNQELSVYPNPVQDILYVDGTKAEDLLEVYDLSGVRIKTSKGSEMDVKNLSAGIYILKTNGLSRIFIKE